MSGPARHEDAERAYQEVRRRICAAVKARRIELDLSQTEFAEAVLNASSRFVVNRLENGTTDLSSKQARAIDDRTGRKELEPLVEHRERLLRGQRADVGRNELLRRMLQLPGIDHVRVVLADNLPLADLIRSAGSVGRLDVVVPSPRRARQLSDGRQEDDFVAPQVTTLLDLEADDSESGQGMSLRLVESDSVDFSTFHCSFEGGAEVAWWPRLVGSWVDPSELPVASAGDPRICNKFEAAIDRLIVHGQEIRPNELVVTATDGDSHIEPRFIRLTPRGSDSTPPEANESYAVSLVLPYSLTPSGHGIGKRLVLHRRRGAHVAAGKLSLVSTRLDESDLRSYLEADRPNRDWVRRDPHGASLALGTALLNRNNSNIVPIDVFQFAAAREFLTYWGLEVRTDRFKPIDDLPMTLEPMGREGPNQVVRLFSLELLHPADEDSELGRLLRPTSKHEPVVIGRRDLFACEADELNHFLDYAIRDGFMTKILERLDIAEV